MFVNMVALSPSSNATVSGLIPKHLLTPLVLVRVLVLTRSFSAHVCWYNTAFWSMEAGILRRWLSWIELKNSFSESCPVAGAISSRLCASCLPGWGILVPVTVMMLYFKLCRALALFFVVPVQSKFVILPFQNQALCFHSCLSFINSVLPLRSFLRHDVPLQPRNSCVLRFSNTSFLGALVSSSFG